MCGFGMNGSKYSMCEDFTIVYIFSRCRVEESGELVAKTTSDWWVVGKFSDQREFYVILNQKSANIIQINEEVKRLCASQFQNIFFLD